MFFCSQVLCLFDSASKWFTVFTQLRSQGTVFVTASPDTGFSQFYTMTSSVPVRMRFFVLYQVYYSGKEVLGSIKTS